MAGETAADEPAVNAETRFKNNAYFAIYDRLIVEFQDRFSDFENSVKKFSCLLPKHLGEISHFRQLANIYSKDVDIDSAVAEYSQFSSLVNETQEIKNKLDYATVQELLEFLKSNNLNSAYPNVVILYRILGTISVSRAGAERSFSRLKLIKN